MKSACTFSPEGYRGEKDTDSNSVNATQSLRKFHLAAKTLSYWPLNKRGKEGQRVPLCPIP